MQPTIERKGDTVTITKDGIPMEIPLDQLRNAIRKKPQDRKIDCPDLNAFNQFYVNIIKEPSPAYTAILWEIFKIIRTRETAFRSNVTTRFFSIGKPYFLKQALRQRLAIGEPFSFFQSNTLLKHTTDGGGSADLKKERFVYGVDYFADIDCEDLTEAHSQTEAITTFLKNSNIRGFHVNFTGYKGYHVILPYDILLKKGFIEEKARYEREELVKLFSDINLSIIEGCGITPDPAITGTDMQLQRVGYTLHPTSLKVCLPLTPQEFKKFTPEMASIDNVLKMNLRDRGLPRW